MRKKINKKKQKIGAYKPNLPCKLSIHLKNPKLATPFSFCAKQTQNNINDGIMRGEDANKKSSKTKLNIKK